MRTEKAMVLLDGTPLPRSLEAAAGCAIHSADGPLEGAEILARVRATLLVIRPDLAWHSSFVQRFPPETRPTVVGVGGQLVSVALIDEWISPAADFEEARVRFQLADQRARERRRKNRQVFTDALTGLPNRRAVVRALTRAVANGRRDGRDLALVLLDLDGFKQINETAGHAAGDGVLRRVGSSFRAATRAGELCGRIGGDEFALVLSAGLFEAQRAAQRLTESLLELDLSATAAAAVLEPREHLRHLYRRADDLLRAAKTRRRTPPWAPKTALPPPHVVAPLPGHRSTEL